MSALLTMKNIKKSFSGVAALKNAELELNKSEVVALMGENGAGKSTLMKILTGIYSKDEGVITLSLTAKRSEPRIYQGFQTFFNS